MVRHCVVGVFAVLALGAFGVPAGAQDFVQSSAQPIPAGDLGFTGYPTALFAKNNGPDRWGGAGRVGYGIADNFDVQGKVAAFNGFTLVGADATFRLLRGGDVDLALSLGGHQALMQSAPDSTAMDLAWLSGARVSRRLRVEGGVSYSLETVHSARSSTFSRVYVVPGIYYRVSREVAVISQFGLGLNNNSPNYLTAGLSFAVPVSARGRHSTE